MNDSPNIETAGNRVSLSDETAVKEILVQTVFGLWDIVNNLTRLQPSKNDRYRVTVFGSARIEPHTFAYEEVKRIGKVLAEMDCDIITGGGPGLMQAANEGASEADGDYLNKSVGIRVELPFEQEVNPFVAQAFEHKTFFTRLHHFVLTSDAFIVTPGGIGTVLETMMVWQLLQVKHVNKVPLILVGDIWKGLVGWARESLLRPDAPLASESDLAIPQCVSTVEGAVELIRVDHSRWSAR